MGFILGSPILGNYQIMVLSGFSLRDSPFMQGTQNETLIVKAFLARNSFNRDCRMLTKGFTVHGLNTRKDDTRYALRC